MTLILENSPLIDTDSMPVALIQLDKKRRIQAMNMSAENLCGISRKSGLGKRLSDLLYHDCDLFNLIDLAEETDSQVSAPSITMRGPLIPHEGTLHVSVTRMSEGGFALGLIKNTIANTNEIDKLGLASFGRILGHEVKNPLAGLSGATQLLLRQARDDQTELLELILAESSRITRLVDKLSAFELFSSPTRLPCNVHQILEQVIRSESIAFERRVNFERNFDPSLPDILADGDHLHEAFQNIIRNAAEAICEHSSGDKVSISTRFSLDRLNTSVDEASGLRSVKVVISDNGPGISPEYEKQIFDIFQTTKAGGGGLGLTVASQVIAAHEGQISVKSRPGHTSFNIYLPIAKTYQ